MMLACSKVRWTCKLQVYSDPNIRCISKVNSYSTVVKASFCISQVPSGIAMMSSKKTDSRLRMPVFNNDEILT